MTELNITPLLDLAFVLLVIFIITTAPVVHDTDINLPPATSHPKDPPHKANYITIDSAGAIWMNRGIVELGELQATLAGLRTDDPDLSVIVRADAKTKYGRVRSVLDACQAANLVKVDLATEPIKK